MTTSTQKATPTPHQETTTYKSSGQHQQPADQQTRPARADKSGTGARASRRNLAAAHQQTASSTTQSRLNIASQGASGQCTIHWGDGTTTTKPCASLTTEQHTYNSKGTYPINITGGMSASCGNTNINCASGYTWDGSSCVAETSLYTCNISKQRMPTGSTLYVSINGQNKASHQCDYYSNGGSPASTLNKACTYQAPFTYSSSGTYNPYIKTPTQISCQNNPVHVYTDCTLPNVKATDNVVNTTQCVAAGNPLSNNLLWHNENSNNFGCLSAGDTCYGGYCRAGSTWNSSRGKCVETNCTDAKDNNGNGLVDYNDPDCKATILRADPDASGRSHTAPILAPERFVARCQRDPKPIPGTSGIDGRMTLFVIGLGVFNGFFVRLRLAPGLPL